MTLSVPKTGSSHSHPKLGKEGRAFSLESRSSSVRGCLACQIAVGRRFDFWRTPQNDPIWDRLCHILVRELGVRREELRRETRFVELGICDDSDGTRKAVGVAQAEVFSHEDLPDDQLSLNTEPSFFKTTTPRGAFMAWTRDNYYFSAHAKRGEEGLNQFMETSPY